MSIIRSFISSRKWLAVIIAIVLSVLAEFHVIDRGLNEVILMILGVGVAAQAVTDQGKEAAKIAAKATTVLLVMIALGACGSGLKMAKHALSDCATNQVAPLAMEMLPAVQTILMGDTPSWKKQLDSLISFSTNAGLCAVSQVYHDLTNKPKASADDPHVAAQDAVGAANAKAYLATRGL